MLCRALPCKGPFTLGGETVGAMQLNFHWKPNICVVKIFVILQDDLGDKEGRIGTLTACARHYTERRNTVGEFCKLVRELYRYECSQIFLILPQYVRISQTQFAHISVSYIILSILNVTISWETTIQFRQSH